MHDHMSEREVAKLIVTCLNQKLNIDPMVLDSDREWWYVSPLYLKEQEEAVMSSGDLLERIQALNLSSIKAVEYTRIMNKSILQIQGDRVEIIKECNQVT